MGTNLSTDSVDDLAAEAARLWETSGGADKRKAVCDFIDRWETVGLDVEDLIARTPIWPRHAHQWFDYRDAVRWVELHDMPVPGEGLHARYPDDVIDRIGVMQGFKYGFDIAGHHDDTSEAERETLANCWTDSMSNLLWLMRYHRASVEREFGPPSPGAREWGS